MRVRVVSSEEVGVGLKLVTTDQVLAGHTAHGQFVSATTGDLKPAYFAIASSPGSALQLLLKMDGDVANVIGSLPVGGEFDISDPMGSGFDLGEHGHRPRVVCTTGTGIAAVRSMIDHWVADGQGGSVELYYGIRSHAHIPFVEQLSAWEAAGVKVITVASKGGDAWEGPRGYIQEHAQPNGDAVVVLCGQRDMADKIRAAFGGAGVPDTAFITNF